MPELEINRLLAAAAVNEKFRKGFLNSETRQATIEGGYQAETFNLTPEEMEKLLAIHADWLPEFARELRELLDSNS